MKKLLTSIFITLSVVFLVTVSAETILPVPFLSRVSSGDTSPNYLYSKLVAGTGVTITKNNPGANETITIDAAGSSGVSNAYASTTFVSFIYASSTFASTTWVASSFPTFTYGSSTYYLASNPNGYISSAITSLNGLTGASQTFASSSSGTDFGIISSGTTHTFQVPTSSATNRGLLSATDWSTFNNKVSNAYASSTFPSFTYASSTFPTYTYASTTFLTPTGVGSNLTMARIGNSTYSTVQHMQDLFHSSGWTSGGTINISTTNITVDAGTGFIRATDSAVAEIKYFDWGALGTTAIPTDTTRYIGVEYNGGSPQVVVRTTYNWDFKTDFPLGAVRNDSGTLHVSNGGVAVGDHASMMIQRLLQVNGIQRDNSSGGLIISGSGTRNIAYTSGALWDGLRRYPLAAFDTSVTGSFDQYLGSTLDTAGATQWDNLNYNNAGTKTALGTNKWANFWLYLETDGGLVYVYGIAEYNNQASAEAASAPSTVPARVTLGGVLIGRGTFQQNSSTATFRSAFSTTFSGIAATSHSDLTNLAWTLSGHTGTASTIAGFSGAGASAEYTLSGTGTVLPTTASPTFTGTTLFNNVVASGNFVNLNSSTTNMSLGALLYDSTNSSGSIGNILKNTGTSTQWVATSTLYNTASASLSGLLSSADWSTFNNKQATISGTYPIIVTGAVISTGFSTSTINSFSAKQTFTNASSTSFTGDTLYSTTGIFGSGTFSSTLGVTGKTSLGLASTTAMTVGTLYATSSATITGAITQTGGTVSTATTTITGNLTVTGARINRVVGYTASSTITINLDTTDEATTTVSSATTTFANPTGTAIDGMMYLITIRATTTLGLAWGTLFASSTDLSFPTSIASGTTEILWKYDKFRGVYMLLGLLKTFMN